MIKPTVIALALAAAAVLPQPVLAADLLVTYSGFITATDANDTIFGGNVGKGDAISAAFYYTTSVPGTRMRMPGVSDEITGGLRFGTGQVISEVVFTSGTNVFSYSPNYYDDVYASASFLDAYAYDTRGDVTQTFITPSKAGPTNLRQKFSSNGTGDSGGPLTQYSYVSDGQTTIDFNANRVTVSDAPVSAAPEPANWLLMIIGVGGLGLGLRSSAAGRRARGWGLRAA